MFAIVGPTASGKSDLALNLAKKIDGVILSVDSLSIYKEIDIASAKPSKKELKEILHFGVDEIFPNQKFDVIKFIEIFKKAKSYASTHQKPLIIVGGSSFYLKILTSGISQTPPISNEAKLKTQKLLKDIKKAYTLLEQIDSSYAKQIEPNDKYRIQKALELYFEINTPPTNFFAKNPPTPIMPNLEIFEIEINKEKLRERIALRTKKMIKMGLIDEVFYLEKKYKRAINPLKAIGIKESLDFLDGRISLKELEEKIIINTARLAKKQITFNKTQLKIAFRGLPEEIFNLLL
ncbi:MAG: tRNA (adenosine(37)-N6)-dimethylallyltransferase MiaA [Epsilonproteobacteria bacterium]|nr:tRNA (adenosine(37)-N6)-dimethylallyltransferase MiaA [Campylobacterota bacterium]